MAKKSINFGMKVLSEILKHNQFTTDTRSNEHLTIPTVSFILKLQSLTKLLITFLQTGHSLKKYLFSVKLGSN